MNYEVWLNARHPRTLESVATLRVHTNADRLAAEKYLERAHMTNSYEIYSLRCLVPGAIVSAEMRMPQAGMSLQFERLDAAKEALDKIRAK